MNLSRSLFALFVVVSVGSALADDSEKRPVPKPAVTSLPSGLSAVFDALADRKPAEAVKLIDAALKKEDVSSADYLLYLKARAQTELKQFDAALATFGEMEKNYPKSLWLSRARFGRADVLVRQRNYRAAGRIY